MAYKYFGMTTDAWSNKHCDQSGLTVVPPGISQPLCFISVDKPGNHPTKEDCYCMVVRAADCHGKDMLPPMFLAADKKTLTTNPEKACQVSLGWKFQRDTDWPGIARNAIKIMSRMARESGITDIKEWYE